MKWRGFFNFSPIIVVFLVLLLGHGCGSTKPARAVDPELSRTAKAARSAFDQDKIDQAARLYHRALVRARALDDSAEIANLAYNLSLCLILRENYEEGLEYLKEARSEYARSGEVPVDLELLEAKVALRQDRLTEAEEIVAEGLRKRGESLTPEERVQFTLLQARIDLKQGEGKAARDAAEEAGKLMESIDEPEAGLAAELAGLKGDISFAASEFDRAGADYDRQAGFLKESGRYRSAALTMGRAGEAYGKAGKLEESTDRFYRAARSLFAQGDAEDALKMIEGALAAAIETGTESHRRIVELFDEIKGSLE